MEELTISSPVGLLMTQRWKGCGRLSVSVSVSRSHAHHVISESLQASRGARHRLLELSLREQQACTHKAFIHPVSSSVLGHGYREPLHMHKFGGHVCAEFLRQMQSRIIKETPSDVHNSNELCATWHAVSSSVTQVLPFSFCSFAGLESSRGS